VLINVSPRHSTGSVCVGVQHHAPLSSRYLVPLRSARVGAAAAERMEFTIYVLDEMRVEPAESSSYPAAEVDREAIRLAAEDSTNYSELFAAAVGFDEPGGVRSFVVEYSEVVDAPDLTVGSPEARWLTRLRTSLQPAEIGLDLPLDERRESPQLGRSHTILVASRVGSGLPAAGAALSALALAACLLAARRRS
jgi:hypothetical protein